VPPDLRQCGKTARSRSSMSGAGTSFALFLDSRALPVVSQGTFGEVQRCQRAYNRTRPMPKDRAHSDGADPRVRASKAWTEKWLVG
jgi:hypothetical protein